MNPVYKELIKSCPNLYSKINNNFYCEIGWHNLLKSLSNFIEYEISKLPPEEGKAIYAVQVKQKFGGLRFYMNKSTSYINGAIALAEQLSNSTCETCGMPGSHKEVGHAIITLCPTHYINYTKNPS